MLGLTTRPSTYLRLTQRAFRGIHNRVVADVAAADVLAGSRILDVGTGPGHLPLRLTRVTPQLTIDGIDLSPEMIAFATESAHAGRREESVRFSAGDAAHMPYTDESFDLIVSCMSQHHGDDVPAVLKDMRRVLKPTGRVWIYDARFALRRADQAARELFPAAVVRRVPVRTSHGFPRLFARLSIEPPS
jgi:ubiquinone/menaquinone biosynthesis C-methylase UbiE